MSWRVVEDPTYLTGVLLAEDPLYALGPALEGDGPGEATEALTAFAEACDPPPDQMPTVRLITEWQSFVQALAEMQLQALSETPAAAEPPAEVSPGQITVDEAIADTPVQDAPADPGPLRFEMSEDGQRVDVAGASTVTPEPPAVEPAEETPTSECWRCGGTRTETLAGVTVPCSVCQLQSDGEAVTR